jgi:hypothetical protein
LAGGILGSQGQASNAGLTDQSGARERPADGGHKTRKSVTAVTADGWSFAGLMEQIMSKTNYTSRDELTSNELDAVSGGSLPLPAIMATIVRAIVGPDSPLPPPSGAANGYDGRGSLNPY